MKPITTIFAVLFLYSVASRAAEDLTVLQPTADGVAPGKQLELWLRQEFYRQVDRRSEAFEKMLKSESACRAWQADRRAFFLRQIGGLPERTPLNPQIVGRLEGQGYRVEKTLLESRPGFGLPRSAYFYAGRAHPSFGNVALAFAADCETGHTGSATPFDTGGLLHPRRPIRLGLVPADGDAERAQYGKDSEIPLDRWRDVFAHVLAAYFDRASDYWAGRPKPLDPEGLYELNDDWRAWTFEVRFSQGQSIAARVAWCSDESVMAGLRRLLDEQGPTPPGDPPTALDRFLQGPPALEPAGTPEFCRRMEQWVREEVGQ